MRIIGAKPTLRVSQAPRHPEVNQESPSRLEPNNQILAATIDCADALPFELRCHGHRLERTDEAWIVDLDPVEPPADKVRLEHETDRLDLGQLGHQAIVSSTIGFRSGASGPSV